MITNGEKEIIHKELSYMLTGLFFDIHNELGPFAREKQYGDALEKKLEERHVHYERERAIGTSGNVIDFVVYDKVILELKAKRILVPNDFRQTQNYLQQTGLRLGLLINFRDRLIKPRRIVRIDTLKKVK